MRGNRNTNVLQHIVDYCNEINSTIERFGNDYGTFSKDSVYQNAVALCVLQIGELTTNFTEDFKNTYNEMPWNQIKALRNVVAHNYGKIDKETLWETISNDIPQLQEYCEGIVKQFEAMSQECVSGDEEQRG
ncbi:MAG: HepT-like ribonuclease domain-containing protein [Sedimentibacter sp.]